MTALLEIDGLSKSFGGLRAVNQLSFTVREREILGLIGPNGAGKSTVFNLINGVFPPDQGRVKFAGADLTGKPPYRVARHGLARTHQIVQPLTDLTVLENCTVGACFGRENLPLARARAVAREVAVFVGLEDRLATPAAQLTIAGKKRLELARALAAQPLLLLLDEVLAGLNPTEIERMLTVIRSIRERGVAILIIEHLMQAIMGLSDRIVVLNSGQKLAEGTPAEIANNAAGDRSLPRRSGARRKAARGRGGMSDALLEVEALATGYGEVQVLWGLSLAAARGRLTTLVGANGAGKTTMLRAVVGTLPPWSGRVLFKGEDVTRLPAHAKAARGLVLVPEGRQLFSTMTVDENLEMGAFTRRGADSYCRPPGAGVHLVPAPQGAPQAEGRHVLRRRAADARDRPRPDDRSGDPDHRRAVAGAGAALRLSIVRGAQGAQGYRADRASGRAERPSGVCGERLRLRHRRGPPVQRRTAGDACGHAGDPAGLPRVIGTP